jgi:TonB family protein
LKKWIGISLFHMCAVSCFGQTQPAICPKHIEAPAYPQLARQTHLTGGVTLSVTIDADGKVQHIATIAGKTSQHAHRVLQDSAVENMQHWTFNKPPSSPYTEVIVYDYEIDPTLPASGGPQRLPVTINVVFDLPDRVRILTNGDTIDPNKSQ